MMSTDDDSQHTPDRRDFLKSSAMLSAGLFLGVPSASSVANGASAAAPVLYEGGGLTPIAIAEDCARLQLESGAGPEAFETVLPRNIEEEQPGNDFLLGGMVPMEADDAVSLLGRFQDAWAEREDGDGTERKLALSLGWIAHRAARTHLDPLYDAVEPPRPGVFPSEAQVYHDATVLRQWTADAQSAGSGEQVGAVTSLFRELGPRMLIRFHTLIPDSDDGSGWIGRLAGWREEKGERLRRLATAYQSSDPEKMRQYVDNPNFYDGEDPVIRAADRVRQEDPQAPNVGTAVESTNDDNSVYAQALARAYRHVLFAGEYFDGQRSVKELRSELLST